MPEPPTRSARRSQWARIDLPRNPSSAATARRFIEARVSAWSFPRRAGEQLVLIGSELVTNAVLHARTDLTLTLELEDGRARISVKDQSQAPATLRHYRTDALTGRGLGVVAALSDSWGISAAADGKVVWAEVAAASDAGGQAPRPPELRNGPAPAAAQLPGTRPVRFPGVPVETYLELQAHNDALFRELELISIELETDSARPAAALAELVDQLYRRFRGQRDSYRDLVAAAKARGQGTVDLQTSAPPAAAGAAHSYLDLLERADELCRAGLLLTPEAPAPVRELRRWFVEEMVAQLRDGATRRPHPARPSAAEPAVAEIRVREATAEDWPAIWPFLRRIISAGETYCWDPDTGEEQARAKWFPAPPGRTVVAVDADGRVVGTAETHPNQGGPGAHVANAGFMVDPDHAGRGIGRALAVHVVDQARADGYRAMVFNAVVETNVNALALWRSLGFEVLATIPEAFDHPTAGLVGLHVMHRRL